MSIPWPDLSLAVLNSCSRDRVCCPLSPPTTTSQLVMRTCSRFCSLSSSKWLTFFLTIHPGTLMNSCFVFSPPSFVFDPPPPLWPPETGLFYLEAHPPFKWWLSCPEVLWHWSAMPVFPSEHNTIFSAYLLCKIYENYHSQVVFTSPFRILPFCASILCYLPTTHSHDQTHHPLFSNQPPPSEDSIPVHIESCIPTI